VFTLPRLLPSFYELYPTGRGPPISSPSKVRMNKGSNNPILVNTRSGRPEVLIRNIDRKKSLQKKMAGTNSDRPRKTSIYPILATKKVKKFQLYRTILPPLGSNPQVPSLHRRADYVHVAAAAVLSITRTPLHQRPKGPRSRGDGILGSNSGCYTDAMHTPTFFMKYSLCMYLELFTSLHWYQGTYASHPWIPVRGPWMPD